MDIRETIETMTQLRSEIDAQVWDVFDKYVKDFEITFKYPEFWYGQRDGILFDGQDGCMGCYDNMSITIPYEFFEDYDKAAASKKETDRRQNEEEENRQRENDKKRELEMLAQLKAKYENQ